MAESETTVVGSIFDELTQPLNLILTSLIVFLIYKLFVKPNFKHENLPAPPPSLPKLRKDLTVTELSKYDGNQEDGRVLLAVNSHIFDVTKGRRFYGPGGPYAAFAGRDATRGLATGNVKGELVYDDVSDLKPDEVESAKEWEDQFREKYDIVGKLLKPGEQPTVYNDNEEEKKDL